MSDEDVDELTTVLFEEADIDNSGQILFDDFQTALEKHPGLINNLTFRYENTVKPGQNEPLQDFRICSE